MTWSKNTLCLLAWGVTACILLQAAPSHMTVEELFRFFEKSVTLDESDENLAHALEQTDLTERLTDNEVSVLKSQGAGERTVTVLQELAKRSAALPAAPLAAALLAPAPDVEHRQEMIGKLATYASSYTHALPNFLCVQTTRYFEAHRNAWHLDQTVVEDVRFINGAEQYTTKAVNDKPDKTPVGDLRTAFNRGEFGSVLQITFDQASQAKIDWDSWGSIHGKRVAVFRFTVDRSHSQFMVCCISTGTVTVNGVRQRRMKQWASAYKGLIYADPDTGILERFTYQNIDVPADYNLDDGRNLMEYSAVRLDDKTAWLPVRAVHYLRKGTLRSRNEVEFSNYHSFGAKSTIQFPSEDPAVTPPQP